MTRQESATHTPESSSPRQCWRQPTTSEVHHARDSTTYMGGICIVSPHNFLVFVVSTDCTAHTV